MNQVFNPYLPVNEYIPDGEPHVFGNRVYIYGSHDQAHGKVYCEGHYAIWSAPVNDLTDWRYEGVSYRRDQDPSNTNDTLQLWAPDVTQGPDGRYYLYYCFSFYPEIGVAVSDSPAGPFEFYGHVRYPKHLMGGKTLQEYMPFDPAVLTDDDGKVYLYYGFAPGGEKKIDFPDPDSEEMKDLPEKDKEQLRIARSTVFSKSAMAAQLEPDMITLKEEPFELIPSENNSAGTSFEGHGFFEASSIRKIRGRYYFVYSSHKSHELCYAVSSHPLKDYVYGGTIISNGDIGLDGRTEPVYPLSNNHGGIVQIGEHFYIFYHHATDGTEFSRQGCAEEIQILPDGSIPQVEVTSCGLNQGPLEASGSYPASIACHITCPGMPSAICYPNEAYQRTTRITQDSNQVFITDIQDRTVIGYKYFRFAGACEVLLELRGIWNGTVRVSLDPEGTAVIGEGALDRCSETWFLASILCSAEPGVHALYLQFEGKGRLELKQVAFQ